MLNVLHQLRAESTWRRLRALLLVVVLSFGIWKFSSIVHEHYPIHKWLFWYYAKCWLLCAWWNVSVLAFGHAALKTLLKRVLPLREQLVLSFATGVFSFFLLMFLGGLFGLYGRAFFVALPLLMFAAGAWPSYRYARRLWTHLRPRMRRPTLVVPWWGWLFAGYGVVAVTMLYANTLIPENMAYDTRWYHLAIAEHYVAAGGVTRFPEGWFMGAYPHLASFLYTWPFMLPMSALFDRVLLSTHLEFSIFLWTLASVPALVRRLVPGARAGTAWVATFLFPGIFLYDSSLCTNADHIVAFWAIPIYLMLLRAWPALELRFCVLLSAFMAAALNTKYTSLPLCVLPVLAIAVRTITLLIRGLRGGKDAPALRQAWAGPLAALVAGLVLTAPHWAKNWLWYGSPVYPGLYKHFHMHPWSAEVAARYEAFHAAGWRPPRTMEGVKETFEALYTFSFEPHDWDIFHGKRPVFGSLFTLTVLCLPFLRKSARVWGLYLAGHLAVLVWYWVQHEDRYLQGFLPWFASGVAAVLILIWRSGVAPRILAGLLVGLQVVWGGDVYFIPTHSMIYTSPIKSTADFIATGYKKEYDERMRPFSQYLEVGKLLRKGDILLLHEEMTHLGVRVRTVQDYPAHQGGIVYQSMRSQKEVWDLLVSYGVTHVLWGQSKQIASLADDLIFYDFIARHTIEHRLAKGYNVGKLAPMPPADTPFGDLVALFACPGERYLAGLYHLRDVTYFPGAVVSDADFPKPFEAATTDAERESQLARADFLAMNAACIPALSAAMAARFDRVGDRGKYQLWVRKSSP